MIRVKLQDALRDYEKRTGERLSYAELAKKAGVARATVESLGSRRGYNATLATIDKLCTALRCDLSSLVEHELD